MNNKLGFVSLGYLKAKDEGGGYNNNALYIIIHTNTGGRSIGTHIFPPCSATLTVKLSWQFF